jgi:broad specificity phosphatase PhoE
MTLTIKLVRHGESEANLGRVDPLEVGEHGVPLTPEGLAQAQVAGAKIGAEFIRDALVYHSPYLRARQTLDGIFAGAGFAAQGPATPRRYEDPRLREVDHGYDPVAEQDELRKTHGWFYYRFRGGESPADCFDRTSNFLESMMRQIERHKAERALVVTHGLTIRCFVMRFLHLRVEDFDRLENPGNCDVITLGHHATLDESAFASGWWGVSGLRLRPPPLAR